MKPTCEKGSVVITGASTGIGRACALHLDKIGFAVFAGVRKKADAEELRRAASDRLAPILIDVTQSDSIASAAHRVAASIGGAGLAGLVNNAGIVVSGPLEFLPIDQLRRQLEVNVIGQLAVIQAFAPLLRVARGRIVNISSDCGRISLPFLGPYCASKFALEALSDALRMELRPHGIGVSIVEPGDIDTPIWSKSLLAADELMKSLPDEAIELYGAAIGASRKTASELSKASGSPMAVAQAVGHALTARRPKTRYVVGSEARLRLALKRFLPDRLLDRLIQRTLGLRNQASDP